jgi:uncharacterized protein
METNPPKNMRRRLLGGLGLAGAAGLVASIDSAMAQQGDATVPIIPRAAREELARRSAANLEVLERYAAAWLAMDRAAIGALYHDEIVLHWYGRNSLSGDHVGKPAAVKALTEFARRTRRKLIEVVDVMAGPHRATLVSREAFERDGERAELERVLVFTIKDNRLFHCWVYDRDQALVDRFLADA